MQEQIRNRHTASDSLARTIFSHDAPSRFSVYRNVGGGEPNDDWGQVCCTVANQCETDADCGKVIEPEEVRTKSLRCLSSSVLLSNAPSVCSLHIHAHFLAHQLPHLETHKYTHKHHNYSPITLPSLVFLQISLHERRRGSRRSCYEKERLCGV